MDNKKKVLEISLVSHNTGGVEKILYDLFMHIDRNKFNIDFLSPDGGSYDIYREDIVSHGGRLLDLGIDRQSIKGKIIYNHRLRRFLSENNYDVVHINSGAFFFCLQASFISKLCKVPKVIVHSHNTMNYGRVKLAAVNTLRPVLEAMTDVCISCSRAAAATLFTRKSIDSGKVIILNNGIEVTKYQFDPEIRDQYRKKLGVADACVYGHVGRFDEQKNHVFLLSLFHELQSRQENAKLLLIGSGQLEDTIRNKVHELGLDQKVEFLGFRNDVNDLLNCMDVFLLPSKYEGLPIVAIEAQANGLLTVCSSAVTEETNISDTYVSISLSDATNKWANVIIENKKRVDDSVKREEQYKQVIEAGYDICSSAEKLMDIYLQ